MGELSGLSKVQVCWVGYRRQRGADQEPQAVQQQGVTSHAPSTCVS